MNEPDDAAEQGGAGLAGNGEVAGEAAFPKVIFLGDSLSAGYGLAEDQAFPAVLARKLAAAGAPIEVVNAGVSGDTTAGGLRRLGWLLDQEPRILVLGLGANDGLRGIPVEETRRNLTAIIEETQRRGVAVLLLGMKVPTNFGASRFAEFEQVYHDLAQSYGLELVPFLLEGVAAVPELNQSDGIHPTAAGQEIVAANVLPHLRKVLAHLAEAPPNDAAR